jgi:hypothetical protein
MPLAMGKIEKTADDQPRSKHVLCVETGVRHYPHRSMGRFHFLEFTFHRAFPPEAETRAPPAAGLPVSGNRQPGIGAGIRSKQGTGQPHPVNPSHCGNKHISGTRVVEAVVANTRKL